MENISTSKDKPLFTPGPLTTSQTVKQAMLRDLGSRDVEFVEIVKEIRNQLLGVAGVSQSQGYECVLLQGSGTFCIEAVLTSAIPRDGKWLIAVNGGYGQRMSQICEVHGINHDIILVDEDQSLDPNLIEQALIRDPRVSGVAAVHCETTTGIMNPIEQIGIVVAKHNRTYFVDSMSAFGAVEFDFEACKIDYLISSANKCIEGVPGFSFCICRHEALERSETWSRTLSLDLFAQWQGLEKNGQFRFTPPTHAMLAFRQALNELRQEGGVAGRQQRYKENCRALVNGMRKLGFEEYLKPGRQGHIITSFLYPDHPGFDFDRFYSLLNDQGFVIYPGKVANANCFRIGNIGRIFLNDVNALLLAIGQSLKKMNVNMLTAEMA